MSNQNKIAPINLVKASAWVAHHEYMKEMRRKPEDRKTKEKKHCHVCGQTDRWYEDKEDGEDIIWCDFCGCPVELVDEDFDFWDKSKEDKE